MKEKLPFWSLIFTFICYVLFFVNISEYFAYSLYLILAITLLSFLFGMYSLIGVRNWRGMLMSVMTIILTIGLSVILLFVIFIGNIAS